MNIGKFLFCMFITMMCTDNSIAQQKLYRLLTQQDSNFVKNKSYWVDVSFGSSLTITGNQKIFDLFLFGPTIDFAFINKNYALGKIKTSLHHGFGLFDNFSQATVEVNYMSGKIKKVRKHTIEFYYGLGLIAGQKQGKLIYGYEPDGGGGVGFSIGGIFPSYNYEKKEFIFIGIPLEYKIQWSYFGLGCDANLNPYLPYFGGKWFLKIGSKYRR